MADQSQGPSAGGNADQGLGKDAVALKAATGKLSDGEKIGYGLGDTASNLFFQITIYFLAYYFTDVYGLSPKDLALMFLLTRIWDKEIMPSLEDARWIMGGSTQPL